MSQLVCFAVVGIEYPDAYVKANVPDVVIGDPETDSPVGTVILTEVTVPVLLVLVAIRHSSLPKAVFNVSVTAKSAVDVPFVYPVNAVIVLEA